MSDSPLIVFDPSVESPKSDDIRLLPRLATLRGKVVGVIWNNKQPGDWLLRRMQEKLRDDYDAVIGPFMTKPWLGNVAPEHILQEMKSCDAVVSGVGDCGSCMSANTLDAITMERLGVPAVPVGTLRLAETTGRGMARFHGLPDFPLAIIRSRPVRLEGVTSPEERETIVNEFCPQVVKALLTGRTD